MTVCTLGIDTSCYTTSAALAGENGFLRQQRKLLPVEQGKRGLRQSEAVFAHVRQIPEILRALLTGEEEISSVCVSVSPTDDENSYMPVFSAGVMAAESVAAAMHVPLFKTTHQRGHLRAAEVDSGVTGDSRLCLHLSGGTTDVILKRGEELTPLLKGLDLHAGQLVDRVGVALGLPFPAGPYLEKLALETESFTSLPVSMEKDGCHLSGAENALIRLIEKGADRAEVARSVYDLLCRTVLRLLLAAAEETKEEQVLLAGGVASSGLLRKMLLERNEKRRLGLKIHFGHPEYSGDNAVGVALIGLEKTRTGKI